MWYVLCLLTTAATLGLMAYSFWQQRDPQEIIAQAFFGFAVAVFMRRRHDALRARQQVDDRAQ